MSTPPPQAPSRESRTSLWLEVGDWLWGTAQGAFNDRATFSQIVVDAAISMVPLVGDVTGVRDLIAVVLGMRDPEKRDDPAQWVLLVVLLFSLVPVIGGAVKGVGRLLIRVAGESTGLAEAAAKAARLSAAQDIVAFLNRIGVGNAEGWLAGLRFADHQRTILSLIDEFTERIDRFVAIKRSALGRQLPASMRSALDELGATLAAIREEAASRIPEAIKQLDRELREIQAFIRAGGENTSQVVAHRARPGAVNRVEVTEADLLVERGAMRSSRGGLAQNSGRGSDVHKVYVRRDGFPNLLRNRARDNGVLVYRDIQMFAGKIDSVPLGSDSQVFRVFGPSGIDEGSLSTLTALAGHRVAPSASKAAGGAAVSVWGVGAVPTNLEDWRRRFAVLDEWNADGFIIVGKPRAGAKPLPACVGVVAEQKGRLNRSQYLPGGGTQAVLEIPQMVTRKLNELGKEVSATGKPAAAFEFGVDWQIYPTSRIGWSPGVHGFPSVVGPGGVAVSRLGAKEYARKGDSPPEEQGR